MKTFKQIIVLMIAGSFFAACWGDIVSVYPRGGGLDTTSGADDTAPLIVEPEFFEGGGVSGGAIDGYVNLYFFDEVNGDPIVGAKVMLEAKDLRPLVGETDLDGLLVLTDEAIKGPVNVHVLADGFVTESILELNAVNATFPIRPIGGLPQIETATVSGTVNKFEMMNPPEIDEYRKALVYYDIPMKQMVTMRNMDFAIHRYVTEVLPDSEGNTFSLEVPATRGVLYAIAGKVKNMGTVDPADDRTDWVILGADFSTDPGPDDEIEDVEISLNHNLSRMFIVKPRYPSTCDEGDADLGLDLGELGTLWLESQPSGNTIVFPSPDLELGLGTQLETGEITLITRGEQEIEIESDGGMEQDMFETMPRVMKFENGFDSFADYETEIYATGPMLSAPVSPSWDGEVFTCLGVSSPSVGTLVFEDSNNGQEHWRVTSFGSIPDSLEVPQFPADWLWNGVPKTNVVLRIWVATLSGDSNEMMFDDFGNMLEEIAFNATLETP